MVCFLRFVRSVFDLGDWGLLACEEKNTKGLGTIGIPQGKQISFEVQSRSLLTIGSGS